MRLSLQFKSDIEENSVSVTISASRGEPFKGFLLEARLKANSSHIVNGRFTADENSLLINCNSSKKNSLTHGNVKDKKEFITKWIPPANFKGKVIFRGTVLKDFKTFWVNIDTSPLWVVGPSLQPERKPELSVDLYSDCEAKRKSCFGMPALCVKNKNCYVILTCVYKNGEVEFKMTGTLGLFDKYIAVGISEDVKMGEDSITECMLVNRRVVVRQSWNINSTYKNEVLDNELGIYDQSGEYVDGVITCHWKQKVIATRKNTVQSIIGKKYHLLLVKGPASVEGVKRKHNERAVSDKPVNLMLISTVEGDKVPLFIKLHGSFMVTAWIGFVGLAMIIARHYKQVWQNNTLCTMNIWFAVHQFLMLLSLSLIIAAFVLIFLHVEGWSQVDPNPHPITGCVATGLALLQPIMALFLPKPDAKNRSIFNWLHWFVGNTSKILAVLTIFLAVSLEAANLPYAYYWILVGYITFYFLFQLLMHIHACIVDRKKGTEKGKQELNGEEQDSPKDAPGSNFRRFMLGIYIVIVAGLVAALVLLIWL
ncbi:putative ferric-chelate reductase 1 homolog isoform X2 [Limulus polyphemus]|uniref:ascorbate ferrireductase (transmembrane) n=1 Tax=Limulus polyphemus TaxID=6850 RepID=A0ABM1S8T1_LIMPO|nr:putative ferric-chelate reductase 1 homolog isoform X2 [Limulus polyphemus]